MDRILELIESTNPDDVMLGITFGLLERDKSFFLSLGGNKTFTVYKKFNCTIDRKYSGKFYKSSRTGFILYIFAAGDAISYEEGDEYKDMKTEII